MPSDAETAAQAVREALYKLGWYIEQQSGDTRERRLIIRPWEPEPGGEHEDRA